MKNQFITLKGRKIRCSNIKEYGIKTRQIEENTFDSEIPFIKILFLIPSFIQRFRDINKKPSYENVLFIKTYQNEYYEYADSDGINAYEKRKELDFYFTT